jgi:hypothetical protein
VTSAARAIRSASKINLENSLVTIKAEEHEDIERRIKELERRVKESAIGEAGSSRDRGLAD